MNLQATMQETVNMREEDDKVMELGFFTKKEIAIKDISLYSITILLKHVQRNKSTPETMQYNLRKTLNWNDISNVNYTERSTKYAGSITKYTEGACNRNTLKPLSERFGDNIIFYYLVPIDPNNKNKVEYLSKFLAKYTFKIKRNFDKY